MKKYKLPKINGWMSDEEMYWLYEKAKLMASIAEIGCWRGRSTHALLSGCTGPVFAIDTFEGSPSEIDSAHSEVASHDIRREFLNNLRKFKNLVPICMDSVSASRYFAEESIDMVFIDGSHSYKDVLADIWRWKPICRWLLCGHDRDQDGVPKALKKLGLKIKKEAGTIWSVDMTEVQK
jgi:predicted O-methyltransferase YrrM